VMHERGFCAITKLKKMKLDAMMPRSNVLVLIRNYFPNLCFPFEGALTTLQGLFVCCHKHKP
jgi:hypothetical protein